ncbi:MAG: DUF4037 domain-containing protein [Clostridia bacterium]|nr:DUF4037 domain-containing protein [Clostridia bacterium]
MKGLELSERFYLEYGVPMIKEQFSHVENLLAIGLIGSGSECFGYDDKISTDHDFEPGFCIFIPDEEIFDRRTEFLLERAYAKLPKEFMGYKRNMLNPVGGNRHGVIRISQFIKEKTGTSIANMTCYDWLHISEQSILEVTNGKLFCDNYGELTTIREKLSYMPEDIRLKKLAGNLLVMCQSGQYNFERCMQRKETGSAQLALFEFVKSTMNVIFLLNKKYIPYYKWSFKALRSLKVLSNLSNDLEYLISSENNDTESAKKQKIIEKICMQILTELEIQSLSKDESKVLEAHAYTVNNKISSPEIRNFHILTAI